MERPWSLGYHQTMFRQTLLLLALLALTNPGAAYNRSHEQRTGKLLAEGQAAGEVTWLRTGGNEFLTLYRDYSTDRPQGAVVLLHGMGGHPDWPEVVGPLRSALPVLGWATLSVQLPVLSPSEPIADYGKTLAEARQRIQVAVRQLRDWRFNNIVIIAYGFGAATAAHALSTGELDRVKAFVGISMQAQQFLNPRLRLLKQLEAIDIPVLDIYGSRDMLEVKREADDRRLAARKNGNRAYRQVVVEGADHFFTGLQDVLVKRIQGWLLKASPGSVAGEEGMAGNEDTKEGSEGRE